MQCERLNRIGWFWLVTKPMAHEHDRYTCACHGQSETSYLSSDQKTVCFQVTCEIWHLWWDESIGYFLHWRKWICFSPTVMVDIEFARFIFCTFYWRWRNQQRYLFVFFEYCDCTENTVRIWIRRVTWKINIFSISFTLVFVDEDHEVHEGIGRRS